jgi:hypothetical protein
LIGHKSKGRPEVDIWSPYKTFVSSPSTSTAHFTGFLSDTRPFFLVHRSRKVAFSADEKGESRGHIMQVS